MSSPNRTQQLNTKIARAQAVRQVGREAASWSAPFLKFIFMQQSRYLLWSVAMVLVSILEIGLLAYVHYIYFPPISLAIMRVLSGVSLVGLLAALATRQLDFARQSTYVDRRQELGSHVLAVARVLFLVGVALTSALLLYLYLFSGLERSTPSIYRAVIVGAVCGLPFEIYASYVLYNLAQVQLRPMRRSVRRLALCLYGVALIFLCLDSPFFYLIFSFAPRGILALEAWLATSGKKTRDLWSARATISAADWRQAVACFKFLTPSAALVISLEAAFFIMFGRLCRLDSGVALTIFLAHKLIHLASILGLKAHLTFAKDMSVARKFDDKDGYKLLSQKIFSAAGAYTLIALAFMPLVLAQRAITFWASPTGQHFTISLSMICLIALAVTCRAMSIVSSSLLSGRAVSATRLSLSCAFPLLIATTVRLATSWLALRFSIEELALIALGIDIALNCALAWFNVLESKSVKEQIEKPLLRSQSVNFVPFLELISKFAKPSELPTVAQGQPYLGVLELWEPIDKLGLTHFKHLIAQVGLSTNVSIEVCIWGSKSCLLYLSSCSADKESEVYCALLGSLGLKLKRIQFASYTPTTLDVLKTILPGAGNAPDALFDLALNRRIGAKGQNEQDDLLLRKQLEALLYESQLSANKTSLANQGITVLVKDSGWPLHSITNPELRLVFARYLEHLTSGQQSCADTINPSLWAKSAFAGMLHLNHATNARVIIYLDPQRRTQIDSLRRWAFRHNLAVAAAGHNTAQEKTEYPQNAASDCSPKIGNQDRASI